MKLINLSFNSTAQISDSVSSWEVSKGKRTLLHAEEHCQEPSALWLRRPSYCALVDDRGRVLHTLPTLSLHTGSLLGRFSAASHLTWILDVGLSMVAEVLCRVLKYLSSLLSRLDCYLFITSCFHRNIKADHVGWTNKSCSHSSDYSIHLRMFFCIEFNVCRL